MLLHWTGNTGGGNMIEQGERHEENEPFEAEYEYEQELYEEKQGGTGMSENTRLAPSI